MFKGKTQVGLDLLANRNMECSTLTGKGGVLHLDQLANPNETDSMSAREVLVSKHPTGQSASLDSSLQGPLPEVYPVVFNSIDSHLIRSTALRTSGDAGPCALHSKQHQVHHASHLQIL